MSAKSHLYRRDDPQSSVVAAVCAAEFVPTHEGIIFGVLLDAGARGATSKEIAAMSRLTDVQIARRLKTMERKGTVKREIVMHVYDDNHCAYSQRNGCAIWRAA